MNGKKVVAIVQARVGSTRLPGKVLRRLGGATVLQHVVQRIRRCTLVDEVVVATTTQPADDAIEKEGLACGAPVFRGSEEDVLCRYCGAAERSRADIVVRVTSDCPLFDGELLTEMLQRFALREGLIDYLSNTVVRTFPRGLDAEVFPLPVLRTVNSAATRPHQREHVTPYIFEHPDQFRIEHFVQPRDLSFHRWTLDTPEDWAFLERVFAELGTGNDGTFSTQDVLGLLAARPDIVAINSGVRQKKLAP